MPDGTAKAETRLLARSKRADSGCLRWTGAHDLPPLGQRSLIAAEFLQPERDGEVRVLLSCDCGTATDLTVRLDGPETPGGRSEAAFTCDGCRTVHWFTMTARGDGSGA